MSGVRIIEVTEADDGMRLDRWFRLHYPRLRHGAIEKMLRKGQIRVDGGRVKAGHRMVSGAAVRVPPIPPIPVQETAGDGGKPTDPSLGQRQVGSPRAHRKTDQKKILAEIGDMRLYEDEHMLVINKPFGLAVQGGTNTHSHIDGMLAVAHGAADGDRPRLVHRLDRDTGGVLLLAKSRKAAAKLALLFQRHQVEKEYWALCAGVPRPAQGTIKLPIAKKMVRQKNGSGHETVMPAGDGLGKKALTDFQLVEEVGGKASFLALRPITGRTHQLRVHCAAMGHGIIGDRKYGGARASMEGISGKMHLFCRSLRLPHPHTGRPLKVEAPLTGHMRTTWQFFDFPGSPEIYWPDGIDA